MGDFVAVFTNDCTTWFPLASGHRCIVTATKPETIGVAYDVPRAPRILPDSAKSCTKVLFPGAKTVSPFP